MARWPPGLGRRERRAMTFVSFSLYGTRPVRGGRNLREKGQEGSGAIPGSTEAALPRVQFTIRKHADAHLLYSCVSAAWRMVALLTSMLLRSLLIMFVAKPFATRQEGLLTSLLAPNLFQSFKRFADKPLSPHLLQPVKKVC